MRWAVLVVAGCHVVTQDQVTRPLATRRVVHSEGAIARKPTLVLTETGMLRFVEPLECPSEEIVTQQAGIEIVTKPNYATFVVGVVAIAAGGILVATAASGDDPGGSPFLYAGLGLGGAGLPFAIGPHVGNRSELRPTGEATPLRRPAAPEPCGERAFGRAATLQVRG